MKKLFTELTNPETHTLVEEKPEFDTSDDFLIVKCTKCGLIGFKKGTNPVRVLSDNDLTCDLVIIRDILE